MIELKPDGLVTQHFALLEDKRALEVRIRHNNTKTAKVLAEAGHFDALAVNWTLARRIFRRSTNLS